MKNTIFKYRLFNLFLLLNGVFFPQNLYAQLGLPEELRPRYVPNVSGLTAEEKVFSLTGSIIITIMQITGGVAILLLIFNGLKYALSRGEDSEIEQAKTNILWIVGGLLLMTIAYIVIRFAVQLTLVVEETI